MFSFLGKEIKSPLRLRDYCVIALVAAVAGIYLGRGSFTHQLLVMGVSFWVGLPVLVATFFFGWYLFLKKQARGFFLKMLQG